MNATATSAQHSGLLHGSRHSILDLAPLELECMSVLWLLKEGTVREIHARLVQSRPRAYTTIMTIMDRLARKGMVTRLKTGRAYRYRPQLSAEDARARAVEKVAGGFFQGSIAALAAYVAQLKEPKSAASVGESALGNSDNSA